MFMSKIEKGILAEDTSSSRFRFDLLGDIDGVEQVVRGLGKVRKRMSTIELGTLAGIGVLDQYRAAIARTELRWWRHPRLALASFYGLLAIGLPLIGFVAGMAIDVAVFGGAAESLMRVSPIYAAFAVGSLVFAVGLAIAPDRYRGSLMIVMMIACLGASMIAADNPAFRSHFANWLPMLKTEEAMHERRLSALQTRAAGISQAIATKQKQVQPDGRPDLLDDGTRDNDDIARKIYADIGGLETTLVTVKTGIGVEQAALAQSRRENLAQYIGRIVGGVYIFCWLLASQFVIAVVLEIAAGKLAEQREQATAHDFARRFVADVDGADREKSTALVEAAVSDMLVRRFSPILAEESKADGDKLEIVTTLFEQEGLDAMREAGVALVCRTLAPRAARDLSTEPPAA